MREWVSAFEGGGVYNNINTGEKFGCNSFWGNAGNGKNQPSQSQVSSLETRHINIEVENFKKIRYYC